MNKKLKILISAYACNPDQGSEWAVGWGWSRAAAEYQDVWVITESCNRKAIEDYMKKNGFINNLHFSYVENPPFYRFTVWFHHFFPPLLHWFYIFGWQRKVFKTAKALHEQENFDLVHNLTFVGFRLPGYLSKLNVPFVWGPIGGLEQTNLKLLKGLGIQEYLYFYFRNLLNVLDKKCNKMARQSMRTARSGIIAATTAIKSEIMLNYGEESVVISEVGVPFDLQYDEKKIVTRSPEEPLKLIWIGRFVPCKGFPFFLEAVRGIGQEYRWKMDVYGDGLNRKKWQKQSRLYECDSQIAWHGNVSRMEVLEALKKSHALVVTSVYELTSTVVIEALHSGVPVICPDHCGFIDVIDDSSGIRIPSDNAPTFIDGLRRALKFLYDNENCRQALCFGAYKRSETYMWERKAVLLKEIYETKLKCINKVY